MLFVKDGIKIGVNNPVCFELFREQGWKPLESETPINKEPAKDEVIEVAEETVEDNQENEEIINEDNENGQDDNNKPHIYTKGDFVTWSKEKILEVAENLGYTITSTKKADMIEEFLTQQNK